MGTINHNAIIATTLNINCVSKIESWISDLSPDHKILFSKSSGVFGQTTYVMTPDGSKEGWPDSDEGDLLRNQFISILESFNFEDGSNPWRYVEVSYGDYGQSIVRGNNIDRYLS